MTTAHVPIPFRDAADFRMTFGKHAGKRLDDIARTDDGLLYVDWLRTLRLDYHTRNAVESYLADPTIAKDLAAILERRRG